MNSPSSSSSPSPPLSRNPRFVKRSKLRNATFIIPGTRERSKRHFTLRNHASFDGTPHDNSVDSDDDNLLPFDRRSSSEGTLQTTMHNTKVFLKRSWQWLSSPTGRGVLKCSLAYLLGSMGTFFPPISRFLGNQDGKHMLATTVVYFHPSRSAGSMLEADVLGIIVFLYFSFISISSMAVSVLCETQFGLITLGHIIVLVVFCGGGLGFVGWVKQTLNDPLVNVACSLTSLAIIVVLTKENAIQTAIFTNDKIFQVIKMVSMAIVITTAVNLLLWPVSARRELHQSMIDTTDAFGDMLTTITRSFLSGSESDLKSAAFLSISRRYKGLLAQLKKNLKEARAEHYVLGTEKEYHHQAKLVDCMQRLAQAIGGLRSAAMTQFMLLKEVSANGISTPANSLRFSLTTILPDLTSLISPLSPTLKSKHDRFPVLTAIDEAPDESSEAEDAEAQRQRDRYAKDGLDNTPSTLTIRTPPEIFARFIMHLGPSMKSLAYTLSKILEELPFSKGPEFKIAVNDNFRTSLTDALNLYSNARADALGELYKSKELKKDRLESIEADFEEVAASCGHFSFSLQDFAYEMQIYLEVLEDLKTEVEQPTQRTWNWLKFWKGKFSIETIARSYDSERISLINNNEEAGLPKDHPDLVLKTGDLGAISTKRTKLYSRILKMITFFKRDDIHFAIKVGIGAALWAMIAYIPTTRPFYSHWRGEWGLVSFMLVCSMTVGASNTTGYARFIGTLLGAIMSVTVWISCQGNPFALASCGWIFSIFCFYLIIGAGKGPLGRFILLTYNLSVLYSYSLSVREGENDDDEGGVNPIITEITLHRVVAVLSGVIWALIITRIIWPISARKKFKDGLSLLWLRMGLIWKRDPLSALLEGESTNPYMDLKEEFALQRYVSRLESLRSAAASEFELRGPFPKEEYGRIMDSTNKMLDAFHSMNVAIHKELTASTGKAAALKYTVDERAQLCTRISHLFQVLASSMKLEYPLNDALPNTIASRDRYLAKIFQFRKDEASLEGGPIAKDEDYALFYAYALVTGQISEEITRIEKEIEGLFGVLDEEVLRLQ